MMNSLLLTFYLLQWKKSSKSVVCDQIQMFIAVTNVLLQGCMSVSGMLNPLAMFFNISRNLLLLMLTLQFTLFYVSAWNTAWLSIFFYVRLVNLSHPYLLRMKTMFLSSVPQLLVGSALGSIIISFPFYWLTEINLIQNGTHNVIVNFKCAMINSFFGFFLPSTLTCLCIGQCVTSLLRHVWRIKLSESHLSSSQLQGHVRAARIMTMRVVLDMAIIGYEYEYLSFGTHRYQYYR
ncbi:PREDICTED: taste receptor type 2 member 40-like [Nanorana parkeri]|uniref:taste receptor type 2 member 40-like n=1 Tax=Nanorana parkeri TaxID=125878 RepID=UPI000854B3C2|nr:PREDICTED: taste receptor type 2 member 40-like [Nanorana parkeri]